MPKGDRLVALAAIAVPAAWLLAPAAAQAEVRDPLCRAAPAVAPGETREETLTAANALSRPADRPRARALYLAVLATEPDDDEAEMGLARVDVADGCDGLAEAAYRRVLARSPMEIEARAGLVDLLFRARRLKEAGKELDEGLKHSPLSPELLARRGRLAYWSGDVTVARQALDRAEGIVPHDPDVRETRDRVALGQVRLGQRLQHFPTGYDDVYTTDVEAMQRWRRLRFEIGATVLTRFGAERTDRRGPTQTTILDGRTSFGAFYHYGAGGWVGPTVSFSAPADTLPRYTVGLSGLAPLTARLSFFLNVALWQYLGDRSVYILNPALGVAVTDRIDVALRYWLTTVVIRPDGGTDLGDSVHSFGLRASVRPLERLSVGLDYTYGIQLERNPTGDQLLELRSHVVGGFARYLVSRTWGVDGALSLERRESLKSGAVVLGPAVEAGIFLRW